MGKDTAGRSSGLVLVNRCGAWSPCPIPKEPEPLRGPKEPGSKLERVILIIQLAR
jgi:hypothetical protein